MEDEREGEGGSEDEDDEREDDKEGEGGSEDEDDDGDDEDPEIWREMRSW